MDGLIYMLNQAGLALSQANQQIEALTKKVEELSSAKTDYDDEYKI